MTIGGNERRVRMMMGTSPAISNSRFTVTGTGEQVVATIKVTSNAAARMIEHCGAVRRTVSGRFASRFVAAPPTMQTIALKTVPRAAACAGRITDVQKDFSQ